MSIKKHTLSKKDFLIKKHIFVTFNAVMATSNKNEARVGYLKLFHY